MKMPEQLTFQRGYYTGNWVEDEHTELTELVGKVHDLPAGGSGSLTILFKGEEEVVLHDKAEQAAEKIFTSYVTPDHHHMAEEIFYNFTAKNITMANGIDAIAASFPNE